MKEIREIARQLVSKRLLMYCGMCISDVPDTAELCNIVDEVEEMLQDSGIDKWEINNFLKESINEDTIEELIL